MKISCTQAVVSAVQSQEKIGSEQMMLVVVTRRIPFEQTAVWMPTTGKPLIILSSTH